MYDGFNSYLSLSECARNQTDEINFLLGLKSKEDMNPPHLTLQLSQ